MKHITITCDGFNEPGFLEIPTVIFCKTNCEDYRDIAQWVNEHFGSLNAEWSYSTREEIANNTFEYFNPYVGEVNESTWN